MKKNHNICPGTADRPKKVSRYQCPRCAGRLVEAGGTGVMCVSCAWSGGTWEATQKPNKRREPA